MRRMSFLSGTIVWLVLLAVSAEADTAQAHQGRPAGLQDVAFDQRLGAQVPLDLAFRDASGRAVQLREYFGERPVILVPAYYNCPMLCPLVLEGLVRSLRALSFTLGKEFEVVTFSFNPRDTGDLAAALKAKSIRRYQRPEAAQGWHFLTGNEASIQQLTRAIGFRYTYDPEKQEYAHATGIVLLTPQGKIARYFYGVEFPPRDLRLGLVEASAKKIGTPIDQVLLFCYQYDPVTGRYSLVIFNALRVAALGTVLSLAAFMIAMFRRERRHHPTNPLG